MFSYESIHPEAIQTQESQMLAFNKLRPRKGILINDSGWESIPH